jgi:hypothetical protein
VEQDRILVAGTNASKQAQILFKWPGRKALKMFTLVPINSRPDYPRLLIMFWFVLYLLFRLESGVMVPLSPC